MLIPFCIQIKPFGYAVPMSGNPACELSVISGLDGRVDPDFRLINIRMYRPIEPFSFRFFFTGAVMQKPEANAVD